MRQWKILAVVCLAKLSMCHEHHHEESEDLADLASIPYILNSTFPSTPSHHQHHDHGAPKLVLNETQVLLDHGPSPISYFDLDMGLPSTQPVFDKYGSHTGTMTAHVLFMSVSFIFCLPLFLYLRISKHRFLAGISQCLFLATFGLGLLTGVSYSNSTPELYKGNAHGKIGWIAFFMACGLSASQILHACIILFSKSSKDLSFATRLRHLVSPSNSNAGGEYELVEGSHLQYAEGAPGSSETLYNEEPTQMATNQPSLPRPQYWRRSHRQELSTDLHFQRLRMQSNRSSTSSSRDGQHSPSAPSMDETLHDGMSSPRVHSPLADDADPIRDSNDWQLSKDEIMAGLLKYTHIFLWRILVLFGWCGFITGIAVYGGACRASYLNGCLAHLIKGSIFFWYGMITFARYVGAWAEIGWAWNRKPKCNGTWRQYMITPEMTECFVIALYGALNTWMERFGAHRGDPFTHHEIEHISIAVLFFFAGGAGMMVESQLVRNFISNAVTERLDVDKVSSPPSYTFSFNIFPALCIGLTGLAMSAHVQEYQFAITIHSLWGTLLAAFAVCRFLTYTFLYLRPPVSVLPSRPPTEALASFFLAAGGIVFILSTEEVVFWSMRNGWDDAMTMMNATAAFVCFCFTWILTLMAAKGWATKRKTRRPNLAVSSAKEAPLKSMGTV